MASAAVPSVEAKSLSEPDDNESIPVFVGSALLAMTSILIVHFVYLLSKEIMDRFQRPQSITALTRTTLFTVMMNVGACAMLVSPLLAQSPFDLVFVFQLSALTLFNFGLQFAILLLFNPVLRVLPPVTIPVQPWALRLTVFQVTLPAGLLFLLRPSLISKLTLASFLLPYRLLAMAFVGMYALECRRAIQKYDRDQLHASDVNLNAPVNQRTSRWMFHRELSARLLSLCTVALGFHLFSIVASFIPNPYYSLGCLLLANCFLLLCAFSLHRARSRYNDMHNYNRVGKFVFSFGFSVLDSSSDTADTV